MPEQQRDRTISQDFVSQSTDQPFAHSFGGAGEAPQPFSAQQHHHYEAHPAANGPVAPTTPIQRSVPRSSLRYPDFGAQESPAPQLGASAQFPGGYGLSPGPPLLWDWGNTIERSNYTPRYEPQGELVQERQIQHVSMTDFSIPLPITDPDVVHQSPQRIQPTPPSVVQYPLSPPPRPSRRQSVQTDMKRKADSEPGSGIPQVPEGPSDEQPAKRPKSRTPSLASIAPPVVNTGTAFVSRVPAPMAAPAALESTPQSNNETQKRRESNKGNGAQGRVADVSTTRRVVESHGAAEMLPSGKVFPIQIGSELFRLSGASISSDAPSYFSHFFGEQLHSNHGRAGDVRTLYIDRDPSTFRDIALHLQGYHISPRDGEHFVRLFADAQFYSLPRLTKQLFSTDIFVRIGGVPFQIPRDLFSSPGDSPNYFSLGFAQFFSTPSEVFPGLDRNALLRPPSISPPSVPNRNGETFGELVQMLQGYPLDIRNDVHRSQLLRDARYFHLRGLEQRLIPCEISYNLRRGQSEILIRLDDIRPSGVSFNPDPTTSNSGSGAGSNAPSQVGVSTAASSEPPNPSPSRNTPQYTPGTVSYARPYTDDHTNTKTLILELSSNESTTLHLPIVAPKILPSEPLTLSMRATFHGSTLARLTSLFSVISSKIGLPATQSLGLVMHQTSSNATARPVSPTSPSLSERRIRVRVDSDCYLEIDHEPAELAVDPITGRLGILRAADARRYRHDSSLRSEAHEWIWGGGRKSKVVVEDGEEVEESIVVKRAHWRIRVENAEGGTAKMVAVLCGVRLEGYSQERGRNQGRGFLGS